MALLTQHGKQQVLAPLFAEAMDARVEVVSGFDTDRLGTFTRDVPRFGDQLEAARKKASLAIERSGAWLGLGSEGSFTAGAFGLGTWNLELVVLLDATRGVEVVGRAMEPGLHHHGLVSSTAELHEVARRAGFPEHGLVIRPDDENDPRMRKGLRAWAELEAAFEAARAESSTGKVFVENDLRAHQHPTRMATIARAGRDLVERLAALCPDCGTPGYGLVARVRGLPCAECGAPTGEPSADELGCARCSRRERRSRGAGVAADPARCDACNP